MELDEALRTTFSCREWTNDPVTDEDIEAIVDLARFAPSGGNRQPARIVAVRSTKGKAMIRDAATPAARVYSAQVAVGEAPWNTINPTTVDVAGLWDADEPVDHLGYFDAAPVVLVVGVDLSVVASFDSQLDRVGVISGASIYPLVWSMLLAARGRGLAGVLTTTPSGMESDVQQALGLPPHVAVAAAVALGRPVKQITKLTRAPVSDLLRYESWAD
ncbi:MAG: nitroreductase [Actinobacteria bacterium]|jgi:nitroreductase|nr:MAG: nitroreductase [Actinomycetota bacterium]